MNLRAIVTSVHAYDGGLMVGSHHLARALEQRGWKVLLLSDPASLAHALASPFHRGAASRMREGLAGLRVVSDGLSVLTPTTLGPLSRWLGTGSSALLRRWPALTVPSLQGQLRDLGFIEADLLMLDGALYAPLLSMVRPRRSVLRMFDWPGGVVRLPAALRARERALAREVDLVAVTSEDLRPVAEDWGARRILALPNGVDRAHFAQSCLPPPQYASIPAPRIVYMGAVAPWIDQALMAEMARRIPEASFVWIGPGTLEAGASLPNVHVLGPQPYALLPAFLQHAQVGVMPLRMDTHRALADRINPLKLYEYAGAGLPAIATPTAEIGRIGGPTSIATDAASWEAAIRQTLADPPPAERLAAFADRNAWATRVDDLLAALSLPCGGFDD